MLLFTEVANTEDCIWWEDPEFRVKEVGGSDPETSDGANCSCLWVFYDILFSCFQFFSL